MFAVVPGAVCPVRPSLLPVRYSDSSTCFDLDVGGAHRVIHPADLEWRMPDDKRGRDKQAHDASNRRWARDIAQELERMDETEPPVAEADIDFEAELEALDYPVTGREVLDAVGDREVQSDEGAHTVDELVPETDAVTYESAEVVRTRVRRPTVAAAMKRVLEASRSLPDGILGGSQWEAYEKTFRELAAIDARDQDEPVEAVADWIVEEISDGEQLPGSRGVRREAARYCRENGYEIRSNDWLGI